jgi:hypothetical protein
MTDQHPLATTPRRPLRRRLLWSAAVGSTVFASWCGLALYHDYHYRVRRLRLGMTRQDVVAVMGAPHCTSSLGEATVLHYMDPAWDKPDACSQVAPHYSAPSELPWVYSSIQVVLDRTGSVSAFVHVGESVAETRVALRPSGTLASLPLSAVE